MNEQYNNTNDVVLEKIRSGALTMRPQVYFIIKALSIAVIAFLVLAVSVWLLNYIIFFITINDHDSLLFFGWRGLELFIQIIPWWLVVLDVALIVLLEWLIRRFRFGYRRSILYLFILLLAFALAVGFVLAEGTRFNEFFFEDAHSEESRTPLAPLYENTRKPIPEALGIFRGMIVTAGSETFIMTYDDEDIDEDDGTWTVFPPQEFEEELFPGDRVYVAGEKDTDEIIRAYGIRIIEHAKHEVEEFEQEDD